jgi:amidohydrolase
MMGEKIIAAASAEVQGFALDTYRHLHSRPRVSFHEEETAAYISAVLKDAGIDHREHFGGQNGIAGRLKGSEKGPVIAFRADFDALPIEEQTGASFKSIYPGAMHACGHDAHTAVLLSLARCLAKNPGMIRGEAVFFFQDAEELPPGGALPMVKAGCMDGVDKVYALHMSDELDVGTLGASPGPYMAASDIFNVLITGKSGHGSRPYDNQDTVSAGCTAVSLINNVVSRFFDTLSPVVISVCNIAGGSTYNIMPPELRFGGTVRTFTQDRRILAEKKIEEAVQSACSLFGTSYEYHFTPGYPVLANSKAETETVEKAVNKLAALGRNYRFVPIPPTPVAEDFGSYLEKAPGCFFRVGIRNPDKGIVYPLHNDRFAIDEDALIIAFETFLAVYLCETGQLSEISP